MDDTHETPGGSSPRTRGAHDHGRRHESGAGLIPADAGSTTRRSATRCSGWAHPRGRGEHVGYWLPLVRFTGSSPRTRGALDRSAARRGRRGLIPADAGSTRRWTRTSPGAGAHPRGRGEHTCHPPARRGAGGSSPRTRGAPRPGVSVARGHGLIPADAGSTAASPTTWTWTGAHPRGRGEHVASTGADRSDQGSSPRTRGALQHRPDGLRARGLIPADAGSTRALPDACAGSRAHPRGRGEHRPSLTSWWRGWGSSPRTRGAPASRSD